jgi:hypothetical protein
VLEYIDLAVLLRPVWWAAQDYCCEPEIAADSREVARRIRSTIFTLGETFARVIHWNQELPGQPATAPMPVIQGWRPRFPNLSNPLPDLRERAIVLNSGYAVGDAYR